MTTQELIDIIKNNPQFEFCFSTDIYSYVYSRLYYECKHRIFHITALANNQFLIRFNCDGSGWGSDQDAFLDHKIYLIEDIEKIIKQFKALKNFT